jgi:NADH dehydrogenase FAD-containing subunit
VKVLTNSRITQVGEDWIELEGGRRGGFGHGACADAQSPTVFWSGRRAFPPIHSSTRYRGYSGMKRPIRKRLSAKTADIRLKVGKQLQVLDEQSKPVPGVFALGDNATPADGTSLPATAQGTSDSALCFWPVANDQWRTRWQPTWVEC